MRKVRWLILLVIVGSVVAGATRWPRVREVETGQSKAYPGLLPRDYPRPPAAVGVAVEAAVRSLAGWELRGTGAGPGGRTFHAEHRFFRFAPVSEEVRITLRPNGRGTRVSVKSRSLVGAWDFGQNARNIAVLFGQIDRGLAPNQESVGESSS